MKRDQIEKDKALSELNSMITQNQALANENDLLSQQLLLIDSEKSLLH